MMAVQQQVKIQKWLRKVKVRKAVLANVWHVFSDWCLWRLLEKRRSSSALWILLCENYGKTFMESPSMDLNTLYADVGTHHTSYRLGWIPWACSWDLCEKWATEKGFFRSCRWVKVIGLWPTKWSPMQLKQETGSSSSTSSATGVERALWTI